MKAVALALVAGVGVGIAIMVPVKRSSARIDTLIEHIARVDTVRVHDSIRVVRTVRSVDSLRDTILQPLTDTVAVKEYIYKTDTLKTACLACVASAARLSATNDSLRHAFTRALAEQKPKAWQKYLPLAAGVVGFTLGAKLRP